jgi:acyl-CoA synthetase (AMP-forming)/AMP-acid ligase II
MRRLWFWSPSTISVKKELVKFKNDTYSSDSMRRCSEVGIDAAAARRLIIRFGFNVYPAEVEAVLKRHAAVV